MERTEESFDPFSASHGVAYGTAGVVLFVLAGLLLANLVESPTLFGVAAMLCLGSGLYLTVAGAVARGLQLARR